MARMVPFPIMPDTRSGAERHLYEAFLEQLNDAYVVYHSVDWVLAPRNAKRGGPPEQGEADFVIAHPEDGLLVLETKGGRLDYDPGTRRWTQSGHSGAHTLGEDPFHQARDEMHSLVRILEHQPGWKEWMPSYGYGVAFPDGLYEQDAHPGAPAELAIDHDDMDRLAERVPEVMRVHRHAGRTFGSVGMDALAFALGHRVEVRTPLKLRFDEEERTIVELTQEQSFIRAWITHRRRAAVTGPAGCGKTMLAVEIARGLAASGARTLLTCFNTRLAGYLRECVHGESKLRVAHFHGLCMEIAREAGLTVPDAGQDQRKFFEETLPGLLEEGARLLGPRFDAMVVDEAQDFREWWWPALLALHADPDGGTLYLFADDNQNLYGGGGLPVSPEDVMPPLQANLRNTRAVHEFVSVFYDANGKAEGKGPEGTPVQVLSYQDDDGLAHLVEVVLTNLVEQEQIPLDDIVLLTPSGKEKSRLWARGRVGRFELSDEVEDGKVLWSSVHAFKGLERPVVILAELGDKHEEEVPQYLYVGGSRARHHLIVIAAEPVARDLRKLPSVAAP